ncbi:putative cytochrome P450 6a13 [Aphis craccivora]|uniref:Putative cytochrome P450 6a13 n=1 Tax=Aphis craccivora TaxID=307492 RepID=A0A6G0YZF1_APHCR|nr:putative cytochrome P450 6a13 [Aphis craccivora]
MYLSSITDWWKYISTLCLVIIVTIVYCFCVSTFKKWKELNVPYSKPIPLFGNILNQALGKVHAVEFYNKLYYEFTGYRYGGVFQMRTPYLMIRDPELINDVLIKDFLSFTDRGVYSDYKVNPLSNNLLFMKNPQWRIMRNKLTPAFTPAKLKLMYGQIKECGDKLIKNINKYLKKKTNEIEIRDVIGKYSIDIVSVCIFGFELTDKDTAFHECGKLMFTPTLKTLFGQMILMTDLTLFNIVRLKDFPREVTDFFHTTIKDTITYREENKIIRNDFLQVLMKARRDLVLNTNLPDHEKFTETQIIANAFGIFTAGFETVSSTICYCLYELALNKDIQDRVRQEVQLKLSNNDGKINKEFLLDLHYLDMVIAETLRMYPPVIALYRTTTQTYRVPNDSLMIEKGQKIVIPVYALHYDEQYYTDPKKFIPERFSAEENAKRSTGVYLPFGDGPRICLGKRFAEMEMKLAVAEMLTKFELCPCKKTEIPLNYSNDFFTLVPKRGIWLNLKKIN